VLAGIAIVLTAQAVRTGLLFDDYIQRETLLRHPVWAAEDAFLKGMFSFLNNDPELVKLGMESGLIAWWTLEELRLTFFRPLTEVTHWLDYRLWPDSLPLMHIHNLFWFGLMIAMATVLYHKIIRPKWVAGFAAVLYALDEAHGTSVGWIANRNALIASVFGIITLIVHDCWRRDRWKAGIVVGPVCFLLGLLSAEAALATGAYLLAYEIFLVRGRLRRKVAGLVPYAVILFPWWIGYHHLGFGTWGSGGYLDPGQEPLLFLRALIERIPILLYGQWFFPDASLYGFLPKSLAAVMWLVASMLLAVLVLLLIPLLKRDAIARFWALGMVLALLPICATFPDNRLLLFVGLGAMGLLTQFLVSWFGQATWLPSSRLWRGLAHVFVFLLVAIHCIVAPMILPSSSTGFARITRVLLEEPLMNLPNEEDIAKKTLVFVNPPIPFFVTYTAFIRAEYGRAVPNHIRILASGMAPQLDITRIDEHSLEFQPEGGFIASNLDKMFRGSAHPMHVGQRVELSDMTVEVLSLTEDQRPLRVRFTFSKSLDDSSFLFLEWHDQDFVRFKLPVIGESVQLPWASFSI
jgi:hypothetical protein